MLIRCPVEEHRPSEAKMYLLYKWGRCFAVTDVILNRGIVLLHKGNSHCNDNLTLKKDLFCVIRTFYLW